MKNTKTILLAALAAFVMAADAQDAFRWELKDTGERKTYSVKGVPEKGTYSVRLRAALMDVAKGGVMKIVADGVALESRGAGFMLSGSKENLVIPGQLDEVNFDFTLRNRCYREFVFICAEDRLTLFGEGDPFSQKSSKSDISLALIKSGPPHQKELKVLVRGFGG